MPSDQGCGAGYLVRGRGRANVRNADGTENEDRNRHGEPNDRAGTVKRRRGSDRSRPGPSRRCLAGLGRTERHGLRNVARSSSAAPERTGSGASTASPSRRRLESRDAGRAAYAAPPHRLRLATRSGSRAHVTCMTPRPLGLVHAPCRQRRYGTHLSSFPSYRTFPVSRGVVLVGCAFLIMTSHWQEATRDSRGTGGGGGGVRWRVLGRPFSALSAACTSGTGPPPVCTENTSRLPQDIARRSFARFSRLLASCTCVPHGMLSAPDSSSSEGSTTVHLGAAWIWISLPRRRKDGFEQI